MLREVYYEKYMAEKFNKEKPLGAAQKLSPERISTLMETYGPRGLHEDDEFFMVEVPNPQNPRTVYVHKFMKIGKRPIEDELRELIEEREHYT